MPSRKVRHVSDVVRLASRALDMGGRIVRPGVVYWDASGGCQSPYSVSVAGRGVTWGQSQFQENAVPFSTTIGDGYDIAYGQTSIYVDMDLPCRKCQPCLARRAARWRYRAQSELAVATRTWFGTLTLRPQEHFLMECRASVRLLNSCVNWSDLTGEEQFVERHRECGKELTKWLKRVRKESNAPLRYLLVAEAHASGLPHYHVLVHERNPSATVTKRCLRRQWSLGFSKWNLVPEGTPAARYVCKYLAKAALARVRASQRYGLTL